MRLLKLLADGWGLLPLRRWESKKGEIAEAEESNMQFLNFLICFSPIISAIINNSSTQLCLAVCPSNHWLYGNIKGFTTLPVLLLCKLKTVFVKYFLVVRLCFFLSVSLRRSNKIYIKCLDGILIGVSAARETLALPRIMSVTNAFKLVWLATNTCPQFPIVTHTLKLLLLLIALAFPRFLFCRYQYGGNTLGLGSSPFLLFLPPF